MIVGAVALWKLCTVIALLFVALIVAAAMRPGVDWLHERRVPRAAGVLLHYLALLSVFAVLVWLIVPQALDEVQQALRGKSVVAEVHQAAAHTTGIEHRFITLSMVALLLGPFYVLLSVPIAAVVATLVDVIVRDRDPAE